MAKVTAPFLSLGASGTLGNTLTAAVWKGIATMRLKGNPSNPQTTTQMHARAVFAATGKISKRADLTESVVTYLKTITPAQQSWASYFASEEIGASLANFEAAKTAYNNGANATVKGYFDDAAGQASIEAVDLDGTSNTQVSAGLALWMAYMAAFRLSSADTPVTATAASEAQVFAFTDALTGVLPS